MRMEKKQIRQGKKKRRKLRAAFSSRRGVCFPASLFRGQKFLPLYPGRTVPSCTDHCFPADLSPSIHADICHAQLIGTHSHHAILAILMQMKDDFELHDPWQNSALYHEIRITKISHQICFPFDNPAFCAILPRSSKVNKRGMCPQNFCYASHFP